MSDDLISREALKKAIDEEFYREKYFQRELEISEKVFNQGLSTALDLIQSAPTVEPTFGLFKEMLCTECDERPKGEWETPFEMNGKTYHKCTHCHISTQLILIDDFCPCCGADMRGDKE